MAVAVSLLMIGGEFDLSAGVMTATTALVTAHPGHPVGLNVWLALLISLAVALAARRVQRLAGGADRVAELHRHPRHVPGAAGAQPRRHPADHRHRPGQRDAPTTPGYASAGQFLASTITIAGQEFQIPSSGGSRSPRSRRGCCCAPGSATGSSPSAGRGQRAQRRRPGPPHQDHALHGHRRGRAGSSGDAHPAVTRRCRRTRASATSSSTSSPRSSVAACSPAASARRSAPPSAR